LKPSNPTFDDARAFMVQCQLRDRGIRDERVLTAMLRVPRHEFVAAQFRAQAYDDSPLPIAEGQTISQPFIVALMLEALALRPEHIVLEIGTGSGYQSALLAELVTHVFTIERHAALAHDAKEVLTQLGYNNVTVLLGDGSQGLAAHAPYDAMVVAAGAPQIPQPLLSQLRVGGRIVIPVGPRGAQDLQLVENANGVRIVSTISGCRFVPLIGEQGYPPQ
jgi:protein-L-isoaspartate(D-aspartate) O-methyltransferase